MNRNDTHFVLNKITKLALALIGAMAVLVLACTPRVHPGYNGSTWMCEDGGTFTFGYRGDAPNTVILKLADGSFILSPVGSGTAVTSTTFTNGTVTFTTGGGTPGQ